jgi:hypothetical protein
MLIHVQVLHQTFLVTIVHLYSGPSNIISDISTSKLGMGHDVHTKMAHLVDSHIRAINLFIIHCVEQNTHTLMDQEKSFYCTRNISNENCSSFWTTKTLKKCVLVTRSNFRTF